MQLLGLAFDLITLPLAWVAVLLTLSLVLPARKRSLARTTQALSLVLLLLIGWLPLPDLILRKLESQFVELPPAADLRGYVGIIVLGGSTVPSDVARAHIQPLFNGAGERQTAPITLLRKNPHLKLIYTGGGIHAAGSGYSEAARAKVFFDAVEVAGPRIQYEAASRTTYENAILSAKLPGVDLREPWVLITSAWHMPRAMGTFAKAGWNVTAYPVDFRTGLDTPLTAYSLRDGLEKWELLLHECAGYLAYRAAGWL